MTQPTSKTSDTAAHGVPRAKLLSPLLPPSQVRREDICNRVLTAGAARLILVRAPAGFGKTTAMAQCRADMDRSGIRTAWLTLDSADNDPVRFIAGLSALVAALGADEVQAPVLDLGEAAPLLMERLADCDPFCIYFDDFEAIQNPVVISIVRALIHHLPRQGRVMLASRSQPDLGLVRMRGRGQLLELGSGELRFSFHEAQAFFSQRLHQRMREEDVLKLHRETEGWAAALWLAGLALDRLGARADFIERFSGSSQLVADYLMEEVFAAQPADLQDFLLRTSVLRSFDATLCEAILGPGSTERLERASAADLFLVPIDGEGTYRYHSLFADFLRGELVREHPAVIPQLHLAASRWYETQARPVPAIDHAIDGGHHERAMNLLEEQAEALLEGGRMRLLSRWFDGLPSAALHDRPLLSMAKVWAVCLTRGPWEAMPLLDRSGWSEDDPLVAPHVLALRPVLLAMMDRYEAAHQQGLSNLPALPTGHAFADSVLANTMAYVFLVMGQYRESHRLLGTARRSQGGAGSRFNSMYAETIEGLLELEGAQLRKAAARFRFAVHANGSDSVRHTGGNAFAGVPHALAIYEAGDVDQAEHLLGVYVPMARDVALRDHIIQGHVVLARIAFQKGQLDHAWDLLNRLEQEGHERRLPRISASARLERSHLFVLLDNPDAARAELERAAEDEDDVWQRVSRLRLPAHDLEDLAMGRLRWEALCGDAVLALRQAEQALQLAATQKKRRRALKLQLFKAIALRRQGALSDSLALLARLLQSLSGEGFIRLLVDEGSVAGQLVQLLQAHPQFLKGVHGNPLFDDYLQRLLRAFGPLAPLTNQPDLAPLDPLTPKETRMLQLLADGLSNVELARRLSVSDSTVRTHLRNINNKLDAQSRTQAVAIGRRLGLIT
ncbi:LuxR C-terminal-related transcriptional regulator [uncultured Hydrogenophaga sp.]|uniref:LuxR C-terminal-related transcriptional regulator n=1 Tax=uncultured Hydrogenophaga sp. TaxID=199683 RepID=UPI0025871509|nr:LuxR C-terminal-related transcriptional regulator [uncultured Hydrogenophaga sp.]